MKTQTVQFKRKCKQTAMKLLNAIIFNGSDNEQMLFVLQILLDPKHYDDVEAALADAEVYIKDTTQDQIKLIDEFDNKKER